MKKIFLLLVVYVGIISTTQAGNAAFLDFRERERARRRPRSVTCTWTKRAISFSHCL
jgi:translation elongation factor EF-G